MTHKGLIREHVKGKYGQWYLVLLMSGKWAAVWWAAIGIEGLFRAIVMEDNNWFDSQITFAPIPSYATKTEALEYIAARCEEDRKENPMMDEFFVPCIEKARRALRKAERAATRSNDK